MKGRISLGEFIQDVKQELAASQDTSGTAFYELEEVELQVAFALEAKGEAKGKLVIVELGGGTTASQVHRVTLKLKPLKHQVITPEVAANVPDTQENPPAGKAGHTSSSVGRYKGPQYQ